VEYKKKLLIDYSPIQLDLKEGGFQHPLKWGKPLYRDTTENYTLITGKASNVSARYKEKIVSLSEKNAPFRKFNMAIRVFNDGLAFRYLFPKQDALENLTLFNEHSSFKFAGDPMIRALLLPGYTTSHEGLYTVTPFSHLQDDTLIDMPLLAEFADNIYVAITEAALLDYAGMYLVKEKDKLVSRLSPIPGQIEKVKASLPHRSPGA
jgi:alpha-glucosidase